MTAKTAVTNYSALVWEVSIGLEDVGHGLKDETITYVLGKLIGLGINVEADVNPEESDQAIQLIKSYYSRMLFYKRSNLVDAMASSPKDGYTVALKRFVDSLTVLVGDTQRADR